MGRSHLQGIDHAGQKKGADHPLPLFEICYAQKMYVMTVDPLEPLDADTVWLEFPGELAD